MLLTHAKTKAVCILVFCILLQGCERTTPEAMLENYQYRISNVLDIAKSSNYDLPIRPLFPLKRLRKLPTTELREGLLDLLKLKECDLIPLIAERNSSLGKVFLPSQKMKYELRFLHAAKRCRDKLSRLQPDNSELERLINEILITKQSNLPAELWNGIFTSKEIEANFSRHKTPLPLETTSAVISSAHAVSMLTTIIRTPLEAENWSLPNDLAQLESFYEVLYKNQSGPRVLSSIQLVTLHLNQASLTLEQGIKKQNLCTPKHISNKAKIMKNIFYKYYIGEVQPYLAHVHKSADLWLDVNNRLINSYKEYNLLLPEELETYQRMVLSKTDNKSLWMQYIKARNKHTQAWQTLLRQCGMMPAGEH